MANHIGHIAFSLSSFNWTNATNKALEGLSCLVINKIIKV